MNEPKHHNTAKDHDKESNTNPGSHNHNPGSVPESRPASPPTSIVEIIQSITEPKIHVAIRITPQSTRLQVMSAVNRVCAALGRNEASGKRLKYVLGQILMIVQEQEFYKPQYERFEDYRMAIADQFGFSRATISECLANAKGLSPADVDPKQVERIPSTNLALVAKVAKDMPKGKLTQLLKTAEHMPIAKFRANMENRGLIVHRGGKAKAKGRGRGAGVVIVIRAPKRVAAAWKRFVGDREPGEVLAELILKRAGAGAGRRSKAA